MKLSSSSRGILLTITGAILWGISGTSAQYLQVNQHISIEWLLPVRLWVAGLLTVLFEYFRHGKETFRIFQNKRDTIDLCIFGLLGIGLCQYTYFKTILYAGAGIATVLQYVAPVIIVIYMMLFKGRSPLLPEIISMVLAIIGTATIALQSEFSLAALDDKVLFWGLLSATAVAIYTIKPVNLLIKYSTPSVVGLGMLTVACPVLLIWKPLPPEAIINYKTFLCLFGLIILGTVFAFSLFLEGVRAIGAVKGSIIASIEPVSAAFFTWFLLGNQYTKFDLIGFVCILATIFILARAKAQSNQNK